MRSSATHSAARASLGSGSGPESEPARARRLAPGPIAPVLMIGRLPTRGDSPIRGDSPGRRPRRVGVPASRAAAEGVPPRSPRAVRECRRGCVAGLPGLRVGAEVARAGPKLRGTRDTASRGISIFRPDPAAAAPSPKARGVGVGLVRPAPRELTAHWLTGWGSGSGRSGAASRGFEGLPRPGLREANTRGPAPAATPRSIGGMGSGSFGAAGASKREAGLRGREAVRRP